MRVKYIILKNKKYFILECEPEKVVNSDSAYLIYSEHNINMLKKSGYEEYKEEK